jgi:hypothetical protein
VLSLIYLPNDLEPGHTKAHFLATIIITQYISNAYLYGAARREITTITRYYFN